MQNETEEYEHRTARVLRGTEARAIARWTAEGWDLEEQRTGTLRSELVFRRPRPRGVGAMIASAASRAAGRLGALPTRGKVAVLGLAAVVLAGGGVGIGLAAARQPSPASPVAAPTERLASDAPSTALSASAPEPAQTSTPTPVAEEVLSAANNKDLKKLLRLTDVDSTVPDFAEQYEGRTIEFDGAVLNVQQHGDYTTRFDFLVGGGDYSETRTNGFPNFQFRDKNIFDLGLQGDVPDAVSAGQNVHVVAKVASFDSRQDLFLLDPVSTTIR